MLVGDNLLMFVVSFSPARTSFSRSDGSDREATSLCRQTTPMPASFAWRLWHARMNGFANLGLRTKSIESSAYALDGGASHRLANAHLLRSALQT